MTEETQTETVEPVEIIRGRMPVAMVYCIRFLEEGTDSELARKYRTTNGKISDIKKGRNFGYVTEDTKFTQDEIDAAKERASQLDEDDADLVLSKLDGMGVATEEEAAAAEEARKSTRKPRGKKAEAEEVEDSDDASEEESDEVDLEDLIN